MTAPGLRCTCPYVGVSRDPYEPHIPAQYEQEQADDCPVHPLAIAVPLAADLPPLDYDFLGTMAEQARGTYQPKHRGEPKPDLQPVVIRTTDPRPEVLVPPADGRGVLFIPPGVEYHRFPEQQP